MTLLRFKFRCHLQETYSLYNTCRLCIGWLVFKFRVSNSEYTITIRYHMTLTHWLDIFQGHVSNAVNLAYKTSQNQVRVKSNSVVCGQSFCKGFHSFTPYWVTHDAGIDLLFSSSVANRRNIRQKHMSLPAIENDLLYVVWWW